MARLTTFSRLLITVAIVAAVFFGVKHFFPNLGKSDASATTTEQPANTTGNATSTDQAAPDAKAAAPAPAPAHAKSSFPTTPFTYAPPAPVNGKYKGVVEVGATGFNSFIIKMDAAKNWKAENAKFGSSLVYEGLVTDDDIKSGLKRYIQGMLDYGVGPKDIHFVISSGARKVPIMDKIGAQLKKMGYVVNEVSASQEGLAALKAAVPPPYLGKAFVLDIGSGNTKIAWSPSTSLEAEGAKYFERNIADDAVYQDVLAKAKQVPAAQRQTCFIIGGVPYELAKQIRNGQERYTVLKAPGDYKAEGKKQVSGLNIYQAVADATGFKQFVFDCDANFTIGFLLGL